MISFGFTRALSRSHTRTIRGQNLKTPLIRKCLIFLWFTHEYTVARDTPMMRATSPMRSSGSRSGRGSILEGWFAAWLSSAGMCAPTLYRGKAPVPWIGDAARLIRLR